MATPARDVVQQDILIHYLISMARAVEGAVNRSIDALLGIGDAGTAELTGEILLQEPRINEMEMLIDEHAVRALREKAAGDDEIRLVVATLKITNDLERMGDLAVNLAESVISLQQMIPVSAPAELAPMGAAVRAMVSRALGALIFRNVILATQVLESDDVVDQYRDQAFERLLAGMTENVGHVAPNLQFLLATRHLERIADHATNVAEDIIFWVRGLDVRHGRGLAASTMPPENVTVNSNSSNTALTPGN